MQDSPKVGFSSGRLKARLAALVASALAVSTLAVGTAQAATVTVFPADVADTDNCFPFGIGDPTALAHWTPFAAFFYKNIPPFELETGDTLAFDLDAVNDADIQVDIALARTTTNGGTEEGEPFKTVVTNDQTPENPRGDTTVGNFDLRFTAETPFSFPGGGLIIRFSDPSIAYQADNACVANLVGARSDDSSGFFVQRALRDTDGVAPWSDVFESAIGAFQVETTDPSNKFRFKVKKNKKKGTAKAKVKVPGPGDVELAKNKKVKGKQKSAEEAGTVKMPIKPRGKAKKKLTKRGRTKVTVKITYAPDGGEPNTKSKRVRLKKKR